MGSTGVMFLAIAAVWMGYLVPLLLHRKDNGLLDEVEPGQPFTETVQVISRGRPLDLPRRARTTEGAEVSTPFTRRAALAALDAADERAARRRQLVLGGLSVLVLLVGVLVGAKALPVVMLAVPVGLIGAFVAVARVTVVRMRHELDAEAERLHALFDADDAEPTIAIGLILDAAEPEPAPVAALEQKVVLTSLLDPVPITKPTYVSKPLAPRTVRTIDLSAPVVARTDSMPVTADAPRRAIEKVPAAARRAVND